MYTKLNLYDVYTINIYLSYITIIGYSITYRIKDKYYYIRYIAEVA